MPWTFKTMFSASQSEVSAQNVDLVFDGLDTFATVTLVSIPFVHAVVLVD